MISKLYIAVPCKDRRRIVELCLPTIAFTKRPADWLEIWDDGSTEYSSEFLATWADRVHRSHFSRGIEVLRRVHFHVFFRSSTAFTHLYLTDSDALHDPGWREKALEIQEEHGGAPVCLYNTEAHARMKGNTLEDDPKSNVIWRYYAPGISYLLTRAHVEKIAAFGVTNLQNWDWDVPRILGHRFAVSRTSYVDHLGLGGLHHPAGVGIAGGDVALNPTSALRDMRESAMEILNDLK